MASEVEALRKRFQEAGQGHVFAAYESLADQGEQATCSGGDFVPTFLIPCSRQGGTDPRRQG